MNIRQIANLDPRTSMWVEAQCQANRLTPIQTEAVAEAVAEQVRRYWRSCNLDEYGTAIAPPVTWVRSMTMTTIARFINAQGKHRLEDYVPDTAGSAEYRMLFDRAEALKSFMPEGYRAAFHLFLIGLGPSEIAHVLEVSRESVDTAIRGAINIVRNDITANHHNLK